MSVVAPKHSVYQYRTPTASPFLLNNIAFGAPEAQRTLTLPVASPFIPAQPPQCGFDQITLLLSAPNINVSTVTMVLFASIDGGVTYGRIQQQIVDTITNDVTLADFNVNKAIPGGNPIFLFSYPVRGYTHFRVVFSSTAPTDTFYVQATASTT